MRSIQSKLGSGLVLSLMVTFSALWLLVSYNAQYMSEEYIATRLQHDTETLLSSISFDKDGALQLDQSRAGLIYQQPFSGHYFIISAGNKKYYSRSLWDYQLAFYELALGKQQRSLQQGPNDQWLLMMSNGYLKQGHLLTISVAEDLNPINQNISHFKYWFALSAFGLLLILVIVQTFILRSSLQPLKQVRSEIKSLEQGQKNKLNTNVPSELRPLIDEVNHLLSILEHRQQRSRNALSDLAHALKKPLTVIQQVISHEQINQSTQQSLQKQTDDIYHLTDRILKKARLAGHKHSGSLFSFSTDFTDLVSTIEAMYLFKNIHLKVMLDDVLISPIDREDMLELLGNLLDNAYKWAEKRVSFQAKMSDSELHIIIEDDGAGIDIKKSSELSVRGIRLDESIQGHGFGLAIATDVVTEYKGSIQFLQSEELGGFKAFIIFPKIK